MARSARVFALFALVCAFILSCLAPAAHALRETVTIEADFRPLILIRSFGFKAGGVLDVKVTNITLAVRKEKNEQPKYPLAIFVERSDAPLDVESFPAGSCAHEAPNNVLFLDIGKRDTWELAEASVTITTPGYYHVYFSNCEPDSLAFFKLRLRESNVDAAGVHTYLGVGLDVLPLVYFAFFVLFIAELGWWAYVLYSRKADVKAVHSLMAVALAFKVLAVLFEALRYETLNNTGHNNGWAIAYYIFNSIRGLLMFAVIVLAGTGWSYLKPFLTPRDKTVIFAVLAIQVLVNVAWVLVQVTEPAYAGWLTWNAVFHLADLACCMVILVPIFRSIKHLEKEAEQDGKLATNLARLRNFRRFYVTVGCYLYCSRLAVYGAEYVLDYSQQWAVHAFKEASMLVFFAIAGYLFRPQPLNPYLALEADDDGTELTVIPSASSASQHKASYRGDRGGLPAGNTAGTADDDFDDEPLTDADPEHGRLGYASKHE